MYGEQNIGFQNQTQSIGNVRGYTQDSRPEPLQPALTNRLREALGYLNETLGVQAAMRHRITGPSPCANGTAEPRPQSEPSLEDLVASVCENAAMICSEAKSLLARI